METAKTLHVVTKNPEVSIERLLTTQKELERKQNLILLKGVFDTINYLARQSLPFRGHRDSGGIFNHQLSINDGNFRNLIRLLASRDEFFRKAAESSPKNATYLSGTMQNEIIVIMNEIALRKLLQKVKKSEFFTILADESSDASGKEQMSIGLRFIDIDDGNIVEAFLMLIEIGDVTAKGLTDSLLSGAETVKLRMEKCRGIGLDGARVMSGEKSGVSARVRQQFPLVTYVHCCHRLNLVLGESCKVKQITLCLGTINSIYNFLNSYLFI